MSLLWYDLLSEALKILAAWIMIEYIFSLYRRPSGSFLIYHENLNIRLNKLILLLDEFMENLGEPWQTTKWYNYIGLDAALIIRIRCKLRCINNKKEK